MKDRYEKIIVSAFLIAAVFAGCIWSRSYRMANDLASAVLSDVKAEVSSALLRSDTDAAASDNYERTAEAFGDSLPFKSMMIDLNGTAARTAGLREQFRDDGIYMLSNGYAVGIYPETSTEYEASQVKDFYAYLNEKGISFLYMNEPTKYSDDGLVEADTGLRTCINRNTDLLLEQFDNEGIPYLDLRDIMPENSFEWFYRTDHHWNVPAALASAAAAAGKLNDLYGYDIDLSLYSTDKFEQVFYEDAWLGEQGKKLGIPYAGTDDYTYLAPSFDTSFEIISAEGTSEGAFDEVLVDTGVFLLENNLNKYTAPSWHYAYKGNSGKIINRQITDGARILVLGDSYDVVTNTFLSLGVSEVEGIVMRDFQGSIRDYIEERDFDTVIMAYAEFMIGAHDDETNVNYRMFDLE